MKLPAILDGLAGRGLGLFRRRQQVKATPPDLVDLCKSLLSLPAGGAERKIAQKILTAYNCATQQEVHDFLIALQSEFGTDEAALGNAIREYLSHSRDETAYQVQKAAEPLRQELLRRLNSAPEGIRQIVKMRADLLELLRKGEPLAAVDRDFVQILSTWFSQGFLNLKRIDWSTAATILDELIASEAVHEIQDWRDLRNRLAPGDRRCYAFFHPQLPDTPLIFVEIALGADLPCAIGPLLAEERPYTNAADQKVATFYSISNTQKGLSGIAFGGSLLKQVVQDLAREIPSLTTFATLSPAPTFAAWLRDACSQTGDSALPQDDLPLLRTLTAQKAEGHSPALTSPALARAMAVYILKAKNRSGYPLDPVARFHLGNGARLERINLLANLSERGLQESYGAMVNYIYVPDELESNRRAYTGEKTVAASDAVKRLLLSAEHNMKRRG
jgi:malonyl-CoA decarboxylase